MLVGSDTPSILQIFYQTGMKREDAFFFHIYLEQSHRLRKYNFCEISCVESCFYLKLQKVLNSSGGGK